MTRRDIHVLVRGLAEFNSDYEDSLTEDEKTVLANTLVLVLGKVSALTV